MSLDARVRCLHVGPESIIKVFKQLPTTNHLLDHCMIHATMVSNSRTPLLEISLTGPFIESMFDVECWLLLAEKPNKGQYRSFHRTLLITPTVPGTRAAAAQLPVMIVNDHLHVFPYVEKPGAALPGQPNIQQQVCLMVIFKCVNFRMLFCLLI